MAMVYDLPTVDANSQPLQQYQAPDAKDYGAAQAVEAGQVHSDLRDRLSGGRSDDESVGPRNEAVIMRVLTGHDLHRR